MDYAEARPWAKKVKRSGPCDNCGCQVSTQWRVGPPCAPTLCNACGVCWGRKKKLPCRDAARGLAPQVDVEHEAPASPLRAEEPAPAAHELASADEAELELAGLLLAFSSTNTVAAPDRAMGPRQRAQRLARPDEYAAGVQSLTRRRTSATLSSGAPRAADTPVVVGQKRARAPTPEAAWATASQEAPGDAAALKTIPPMTPVGTAAAAPQPAPAYIHAHDPYSYLWPIMQLPHDLLRSALGGGGWNDASAWMSVPPDVAAAYAAAAAYAHHAVVAAAQPLAPHAEAPVLPSRVIAQPPPAAVAPATG